MSLLKFDEFTEIYWVSLWDPSRAHHIRPAGCPRKSIFARQERGFMVDITRTWLSWQKVFFLLTNVRLKSRLPILLVPHVFSKNRGALNLLRGCAFILGGF